MKLCLYGAGATLYVIALAVLLSTGGLLLGSISAFPTWLLGTLGVAAYFVAAALFLYLLLRISIYPLVKVFADVSLWLGDARYRQHLRNELRSSIKNLSLGPNETLVLATHSLGSVIAIDFLLSSPPEGLPNDITLITAGSPLRFLLYGFFREFFVPPSAICTFLLARTASFRWINIYRPFDPIGRRLLLASSFGDDVSTGQWWLHLLFAHINYWHDPRVLQKLFDRLRQKPERRGTSLASDSPSSMQFASTSVHKLREVGSFWNYGKFIPVTSILLIVALSFALFFKVGFLDERRNFDALQKGGIQVPGNADCLITSRGLYSSRDGSGKNFKDVCKFSFAGLTPDHTREVDLNVDIVDIETAVRFGIKYTCPVTIKYDPRDPEKFLVISFGEPPAFPLTYRNAIHSQDWYRRCSLIKADERLSYSPINAAVFLFGGSFWAVLSLFVWRYTGLKWLSSLVGTEPSIVLESFPYFWRGIKERENEYEYDLRALRAGAQRSRTH